MSKIGTGIFGLRERLLDKINPEEYNIIICDEEYRIVDISRSARVLFDVCKGSFIADFIDLDVCKELCGVISTDAELVAYDKIDEVYFKIEASAYEKYAVLFFEDVSQICSEDVTFIAQRTSVKIAEYIACREEIDALKDGDEKLLHKAMEREKRSRKHILSHNAKLESLVKSDTINVEGFAMGNLSSFVEEFVKQVQSAVSTCKITVQIEERICCEFSYFHLTCALVSILSNTFERCGAKVEFGINLQRKNGNVSIVVSDNSEISGDLDEVYLANEELNIMAVKSIMQMHNGKVFTKENSNGVEVLLSFPSIVVKGANGDFLTNGVVTEKKQSKSIELMQTLSVYM